eukprot:2299467-Pyramimonas_sp.AAC.1
MHNWVSSLETIRAICQLALFGSALVRNGRAMLGLRHDELQCRQDAPPQGTCPASPLGHLRRRGDDKDVPLRPIGRAHHLRLADGAGELGLGHVNGALDVQAKPANLPRRRRKGSVTPSPLRRSLQGLRSSPGNLLEHEPTGLLAQALDGSRPVHDAIHEVLHPLADQTSFSNGVRLRPALLADAPHF